MSEGKFSVPVTLPPLPENFTAWADETSKTALGKGDDKFWGKDHDSPGRNVLLKMGLSTKERSQDLPSDTQALLALDREGGPQC